MSTWEADPEQDLRDAVCETGEKTCPRALPPCRGSGQPCSRAPKAHPGPMKSGFELPMRTDQQSTCGMCSLAESQSSLGTIGGHTQAQKLGGGMLSLALSTFESVLGIPKLPAHSTVAPRMFQHRSQSIKATPKPWLTCAHLQAFILQRQQSGSPRPASESLKHRSAGGPGVKQSPTTRTGMEDVLPSPEHPQTPLARQSLSL